MQSDGYTVAIVVDREFADRLADLSRSMHVWVCDTPSNRAAAQAIWGDDPQYDLECGVTTFKFATGATAEEIVEAVLGDVDLHHGEYSHDPPWSVIRVIGCLPNEKLTSAFASYGAVIFQTSIDSFEARRT